jgi:hypothetical protein
MEESWDTELPLMLDDAIQAFDCCTQEPAQCDSCPLMNDLCGKFEKSGKKKMRDSIRYWLSQVEQKT